VTTLDGLPLPRKRSLREIARGARMAIAVLAERSLPVVRAKARPLASHLQDHIYSILGFGLFDAACFTHSLFTGLMVTGISFLVFEFKVSEE
jgi:hypothetical protein